jgi:ectoine hydroxylase
VDVSAVERVLTASEREQFERDGFLFVPAALSAAAVRTRLAVALDEDFRYREKPEIGPHHVLNLHDLVARDECWLDLIDLATTFPKVWGVLGWHIQLFHTQLLVTPPAPLGSPPGAYGWHQDNNRMNLDLETSPQPRVSLKVGYFLTDLPSTGMGNLCVVAGSHRAGRPALGVGEQPEGLIEIRAAAGDAIIFDRRLWHAASVNCSNQTRVFVAYGYSYRWLRTKSDMNHDALLDRVDPIRRQLLGWSSSANGRFEPEDQDVPLRTWIREHLGDPWVAP